jgi:hypothetical protein
MQSYARPWVGPSTGTLGEGDKPTFNFYIEISAAPGTVVRSPTLSDSMDPGLEVVGAITSSSNGASQDGADEAIHTPTACNRPAASTITSSLVICEVALPLCLLCCCLFPPGSHHIHMTMLPPFPTPLNHNHDRHLPARKRQQARI